LELVLSRVIILRALRSY